MAGANMRRSVKIATASALAVFVGALANSITSRAAEQQVWFQKPLAPLAEQIVGTWRLASMYQENAEGEDIDQFGGAPKGMFMADRQGNFSFQVMSNRGRRLFANSPPAVVMARSDGLLEAVTYVGIYVVDEDRRKLTLHVAYCLFTGCDQTDRVADLRIEGDILEMTSATESSPTGAFYSYTVWKRQCCTQ